MKKCTKCGNLKSLEDFYWNKYYQKYYTDCKECHKEYIHSHRKQRTDEERLLRRLATQRYKWKYPERERTRYLTQRLVVKAKLAHLACEACGNFLSEIHHLDYSDPRNIWWLCRKHHRLADRGELVLYAN